MNIHGSETLMTRAQKVIPGGVNSPVRAFTGVGGTPRFFESAEGPMVVDVDGNQYVDYVGSWGPMILGHSEPDVIASVIAQAKRGLGFGAPSEVEVDMAELVVSMVPSMDQVRMVNSGTEATMSAIRLARGATGRDLIVKFTGCYHGHSDSLLVKAGSGLLTLGIPNSPGVPAAIAEKTLTAAYNNIDAVEQLFVEFGSDIAAVILEPVAGNMGCIPPVKGFLQSLRDITTKHGALLIFDEVMTGFRVARGGAQEYFGITPDITTLGKIIGGGLPVGAFGGSEEVMKHIAPLGDVYQAGTLSGNPMAMVAGFATLKKLDSEHYVSLAKKTEQLATGLCAEAKAAGISVSANWICGMFSLFFSANDNVTEFDHVANADTAMYSRYFHGMLEEGIYLAPSAFETAFLSTSHEDSHIQATLAAAKRVFNKIR